MKSIAIVILLGAFFAYAENYEFVFPEKIEYQAVAPSASPELSKLAKTINKKCPLEPKLHEKTAKPDATPDSINKASAKKDSTAKDPLNHAFDELGKMFKSMQMATDSVKMGRNPFFNVALEGVSVDDKYIIFALRFPTSVHEDSLFSIFMKFNMIAPAILEGGEVTYGKKLNPFRKENLRIIMKSDVNLVLRAVTRNGKYVDAIVEKSNFQIPYEEVPHKNVKKIKGIPAVKIGNQIWMANNVNKRTPRSKCYENSEKNCKRFGRLYLIEEARKVCPAGWHLPSSDEFKELGKFAKESKALRSRNFDEWGRSMEGTDIFGFNAHPSGMGYELTKFKGGPEPPNVKKENNSESFSFHFDSEVGHAYFWTADVPPEKTGSYYVDVIEGYFTDLSRSLMGEPFTYVNSSILGHNPKKEKLWLSVRCVKND